MIRILTLLAPPSILAMFLCETVLIGASYLAAVYFDRNLNPAQFLIDKSGWQSILIVDGLILLGMYFRHLYGAIRIRSRILLLQELLVAVGAAFIAEALMTYFASGWALPRGVLLMGSGIAVASVCAWRILFGAAIWNRLGLQRVLFIGLPPAAVKLAGYLSRHPEAGFAPVGYLDHGEVTGENGLARLGVLRDLNEVVEGHRPDWIVIGERKDIAARQVDDLLELRFGGVQIEDMGGFCERMNGRVSASEVRPSEFIFSEHLRLDRLNLRLQLMYSTVVALLAIPIALPLMGVVALLIPRRLRGPRLVRERRVGWCGVPFTMYRFRSIPREATAELSGVGKFFVRFGLDRLPQIWNVLRGEMSLVGPEPDRPELAERLNQIIPFNAQRVLVRPGVIGWAQVREVSDGSPHDAVRRLEYDLYYVNNLSPLLDLLVVLRWFRNALLFAQPEDIM